jgi:DNA-binding transcriptional regulator YdaS (Cro superfamily)
MTADDVRSLLAAECKKAGSQRNWAKRYDLSDAYVSDVLLGRREPADAICSALGINRVVKYQVIYGITGKAAQKR